MKMITSLQTFWPLPKMWYSMDFERQSPSPTTWTLLKFDEKFLFTQCVDMMQIWRCAIINQWDWGHAIRTRHIFPREAGCIAIPLMCSWECRGGQKNCCSYHEHLKKLWPGSEWLLLPTFKESIWLWRSSITTSSSSLSFSYISLWDVYCFLLRQAQIEKPVRM